MFHAIYVPTGDLVDAEDLWDWGGFDPNAFVCPDCETPVFPRSYKPENDPRAHFAARPKCPDWCDSNGVAGLIERAQRVRLTDAKGNFPGVMPTRLRVDLNEQEDEVRNGRLRNGPLRNFERPHLFYGPLSWSKPVATEESLTIALDAKEWLPSEDGSSRKPGRSYVAKVDWGQWPPRRRSALEREIETARREAIEAKKAGKARISYLFFVGEQVGDDLTTFHVLHRKLLCALSGAVER